MNKKVIVGIVTVLVLAIIGFLVYFILTKEDKDTTLNLIEKQWIETNKNEVIFMSILNNIPTLSYNGEGVVVDFLDSLNKDTNLSFTKVSYKLGTEPTTDYAFKFVDEVTDKDLLIYQDNYAIVSKDKKSYKTLSDLDNLTIGVLNSNVDSVSNYLNNSSISFKTFENVDKMLEDYNNVATTLNGVVLLKTSDLETIINNDFTITYTITEYTKSLVLSLGNTEKLNTILNKYYTKWANNNYDNSFNKHLSKDYLMLKKINDADAVKFRSKKYYYGYIENAPYDTTLENKLSGINANLLSDFSAFSKATIHYQKYKNINELTSAFNSNNIDMFYAINADTDYNIDVYNTINSYNNSYVVLSNVNNNVVINSLKSAKNVVTLKDVKINNSLVNVENTFDNFTDLINNVKNNNMIVMDLNNYNYYKEKLPDFVISYYFNSPDYGFKLRSIGDNKIFNEMFDFYIGFNSNSHVNQGLSDVLTISNTPFILKVIAITLGALVIILLSILSILKIKPKKKSNFSKEDKLRYVDALTSLKNRNYLNDSIEKWDNSDIYPQGIIIIDLNNVAYINDNYGHAEGDAVIRQAANILILNQLPNSEIIRTNGNEFLIYLVNSEEKQLVSYIRKLNKEFKSLSHGFGAAIGYSMISDAIKTVDDAINEATLDMKNNKADS